MSQLEIFAALDAAEQDLEEAPAPPAQETRPPMAPVREPEVELAVAEAPAPESEIPAREPEPAPIRAGYPFRLELRDVDDAVVERLNRERGLKGAGKLHPTPKAYKTARYAQSANAARVHSWLTHPSESVQVGFIETLRWGSFRPNGIREDQIKTLLYDRAIREANAEGLAWTPVLDALSEKSWPPSQAFMVSSASRMDVGPLEPHEHPHERINPLRRWLRAQTDPREIEKLLEFGYVAIHEMVALESPVLDEALIDQLLQMQVRLASFLARNEDLPSHLVVYLRDRLMGVMDPSSGVRFNAYDPAHSALVLLDDGRDTFDDSHLDKLLEWCLTFRSIDSGNPYLETLLRVKRGAGVGRLQAIFDRVNKKSPSGYFLTRLLSNPSATPDFWLHVLTSSSLFAVREWLSGNETAVRDDRIRAVLGTSSSISVLKEVACQGTPDEFSRIYHRVVKADSREAVRLVEKADLEPLSGLSREDLVPLLTDPDSAVRQRAIFALSRLEQAAASGARGRAQGTLTVSAKRAPATKA